MNLSSTLFDWARFRQTKGAVKLHLLLDHEGYLPVFSTISEGCVHEVNIARELSFPKGSILAIDRGYTDYSLFSHWTDTGVYFVTRQKDNASYRVVEKRPVPQNRNILKDEIILFTGYYAKQYYPNPVRRIEVDDRDNNRVIVCLTNHFDFGVTPIARIYQER
ncbi:IS4 family transposase [Atribacter laminatus]|uniref:IS4 family transposase n=1 Tax=Atribacter laminatus TaxID=2847778 RepID=UPI001C40841C|nr:IS4 family transposase [Atribacter laminatus]